MKDDVKFLLAAALFMTMAFGAVSFNLTNPNHPTTNVEGCGNPSSPGCWAKAPQGGESMAAVAAFMFGPYALPFEVLSLVLLVALVGALFMARLEKPGEEGGDVE